MSNRRRKGRPVSGWLVLDKPRGMTSTKAVSNIKHLFNAQKAGHAGTLDPLATGCLPIALGEATKAMPQVFDSGKTYRFTVRWGVGTDSDDAEGRVVATSDRRPTPSEIQDAIPAFKGTIEQTPPAFSAVKVDGARAYSLARGGETPDLQPRPVVVDRFDIIATDNDHCTFEIDCGKGTYVRSLARDLGEVLGCYGHVAALRRVSVGPFDEDMMINLDDFRAAVDEGGEVAADAYLAPVETALSSLVGLSLHERDANRILRGQAVLLRGATAPLSGLAYATGGSGQLLAVGEIQAGSFHPKRVFHL
jgi:tRNA pseudouridine55 synthase